MGLDNVALLCYMEATPIRAAMSTTTSRIEDDLKARVAAAAEQMGKWANRPTPLSLMPWPKR